MFLPSCLWSGQALAALKKHVEACQVWQKGYESALGLPEELPFVVQLHSLAMGLEKANSDTELLSKASSEVTLMGIVSYYSSMSFFLSNLLDLQNYYSGLQYIVYPVIICVCIMYWFLIYGT